MRGGICQQLSKTLALLKQTRDTSAGKAKRGVESNNDRAIIGSQTVKKEENLSRTPDFFHHDTRCKK
jgi:hypothetical protein